MKKILVPSVVIPFLFFSTTAFSITEKPIVSSNNQNISGFSLLGGFTTFGGDISDEIDYFGGDTNALAISGGYTWENGLGIGIASGSMVDTGLDDLQIGNANFYGSYTFDNNFKLLAGVGVLVRTSYYYGDKNYSGLLVGAGYSFNSGVSIEVQYASIEIDDFVHKLDNSTSNLLIGYKW